MNKQQPTDSVLKVLDIENSGDCETVFLHLSNGMKAELDPLRLAVPNNFIQEVADLTCPNSYGFEGAETYADCGQCVVCRARDMLSAAGGRQ